MMMLTTPDRNASEDSEGAITGVRDARRLKAVADADLSGGLGDADLDAVVDTLRLSTGSPIVVVNIVTPDQQTYAAEFGLSVECSFVPDAVSFCAEVVDTGQELTVTDAAAHPVYSQNPLVLTGDIGSYAGVPLIDNGVVLGSVAIFDRHARTFSPETLDILRHLGKLAGSVLALRRSARMDALTGLPNRALFMDRLTGAVARLDRTGGAVCAMYLDIDNFKTLNDTLGHGAGDYVLLELGRRLVSVLRSTDTVARLGGDEFVILCERLSGIDHAERLAARIVAVIAAPWEVQGRAWPLQVSIGLAVTDSAETEPGALLADADAAMYVAKGTAGSRSVLAATG